MKTKVINSTHHDILLKEGTQGVYRHLELLKPHGNFGITVDPNATYREYWCAAKENDPKAIILSSDDCQDHRIIEIYYDGGTMKWQPLKAGASGSTEEPVKGYVGALKEKLNALLKRVFR